MKNFKYLLIAFLLIPQTLFGAIAFDTSASKEVHDLLTGSHTTTLAITIGASANLLTVDTITADADSADRVVSSISSNGNALTRIYTQTSNSGAGQNTQDQWYLLAPPTGSVTLTIVWGDSGDNLEDATIIARTFTGVKQQAPEAFASDGGDGASPFSDTILTVSLNAMIADCGAVRDEGKTLTHTEAGQTNQISQAGDNNIYHECSETYATSITTYTFGYSWVSNNREWTIGASAWEADGGAASRKKIAMIIN